MFGQLRHIIGLFAALLLSALNAVAMPMAPIAEHQAEFSPHQQAVITEHTDVHLAARAPPLTAANVTFTGAVIAEHGNGIIMHRHETHVTSLGFGVDLDATNRTSAWEGVDTTSRGVGANVPDNIAGWVKGPDGSSIPIQKTANGQPDWKRFLRENAEVTSISGNVDSGSVRFTQSDISRNFKDGRSVDDLVTGLRNGTVDPASLPPIRTFEVNGQLYSLENRRLYAYQQAGIDVPTQPATAAQIRRDTFKFTTPNGGQDIVVRGQ